MRGKKRRGSFPSYAALGVFPHSQICVVLSTRKEILLDELELILMASETASSADEETVVVPVVGAGGTDKRGKHRILAELKRLDQESKFLQVNVTLSSIFFSPILNFLMLLPFLYSLCVLCVLTN